ncbi:uncharacterized protein I303_106065 [Kwoniella dejecticola CBS 10117]|uniref:GH18 domain-containing protein n=1 Tax=Kwoniella dejecticola CBS 10117 TaxID=1296121 RepID=A0AAJ8KS20_9TREE
MIIFHRRFLLGLVATTIVPSTVIASAIPRGGHVPPHDRPVYDVEVEERQSDGTGWHGYRSVGYYPNWLIYDSDPFLVTNITAQDFTHIIYAFANVDLNSGQVYLADDWADTNYPYPGDNPDNEEGNNLYGNLKQLFLLKQQNRNLKIQLGIGGATYSPNFLGITNQAWRETFTASAIDLVTNFGFDGLCLDYGMSSKASWKLSSAMTMKADAAFDAFDRITEPLVDLFRRLREGLNTAASQIGGGHFILSWAAACGAFNWAAQDVRGMDQYLDYWNLMAYDFSGPWTDTALPASNLYPDERSSDVGASGSQCLQHYIDEGVNSRKLNLGMPLYGTGFTGTQGMWTPWTGNEQYDVSEIPIDGDTVQYDQNLGGSWSYNPSNGRVVSFDTPTLALQKARYVIDHNFGGMMYWSIDGDYPRLQDPRASRPAQDKRDEPLTSGHRRWKDGEPDNGGQQHQNGAESSGHGHGTNGTSSNGLGGPGGNSNGTIHGGPSGPSNNGTSTGTNSTSHGGGNTGSSVPSVPSVPINTQIGISLVDTVVTAFKRYGGGLDTTQNRLEYPTSEFDNVRNGFPQ